mmetsp:Transcript_12573/g.23547  ORF Transcript_12573/g.23547 Transcript_12573/m.23547 type:complete len:250 (-) Transcript_12573:47-796(-)
MAMDSGSSVHKRRRRSSSNSRSPSESSSKRLRTICHGTAFQERRQTQAAQRSLPTYEWLATTVAEFAAGHVEDWHQLGLVSNAFRAVSLPLLCKLAAKRNLTLRGKQVWLRSPYTRWSCCIRPSGPSSVVLSNELITLTRVPVSHTAAATVVNEIPNGAPSYRILSLAECVQRHTNVENSSRTPIKLGERLVIASSEGVLQRARHDFPDRMQIATIFGDNRQSTQLPSNPEDWSRLADRRALHFMLSSG